MRLVMRFINEYPTREAAAAMPLPPFPTEWSSSAARQYGKGRWDTPAKHRSVLEAEQAAHKPAPPLRLQSCVEVCLYWW